MKNLILVSHGQFSEGLRDALSMFIGDDIATVKAIGFQSDEDIGQFETRVKKLVASFDVDASLIVLADIIGGSPLTAVTNILNQQDKLTNTVILGGMNFPMALNAAILKDSLDQDAFVTAILNEATTAVKKFEIANESDDDEEI
ncbi:MULTISPECIES: PTS sugar transporter subunit IIA [Leuconostoc]|uniref:PTS fructose transporter subunit IIA n=2 Tax=Leuconostoc kimchii TaxID=136609 RepID=A0ABX5SML2_9LACO|nr:MULTISPECIES: PTS fructose transporter subunit IIA [Leuconostoc]ADG41529.1 putative PTS system, sugar-specific enzyme IIA component [Leuconostoc kimchii IMSNU 11154]AEJ30551.1 putative PTS system, sugar-specific enzyme IIA component [Leuconostoc sp. C2]QBR47669.1 PTS fructose transporter subunit IIA [Leuconostoc kimchii]